MGEIQKRATIKDCPDKKSKCYIQVFDVILFLVDICHVCHFLIKINYLQKNWFHQELNKSVILQVYHRQFPPI
jgi:hypothetical protein